MRYIGLAATVAAVVIGSQAYYSVTAVLAVVLGVSFLWFVASRCAGSDAEVIAALTGLYFVPSALINVTEGALFDVIKTADVPTSLLENLVWSFVAAAGVTLTLRRAGRHAPPVPVALHNLRPMLIRVFAAIACFVFCYFLAGAIIFQFVRDYYSVRVMPPMSAMASMQVLRSLALLLASYQVLRLLPTARDARIVLTIAIPLIGAVLPLLPANDLMPARVRFVHAMEVIPYYALYGYLLARWFGPKIAAATEVMTPAQTPVSVQNV